MRQTAQGFTIVETLLAAAVLLLAAASFAVVVTQGARTAASAQLSTYASNALSTAAAQIVSGNPDYARTRALSAGDLQMLSSAGGQRAKLRPALSGQIRSLGQNPPRYALSVTGPGFTLSAVATAPGGTP
ncbi:hypothetical protein DESA109040_20535 [Deinococcus saxicola]|uniref:hypothetical protein n=1 Tax=Deinococcus saxicola TaxID=249406 RepID=UPI0039EF3F4E